MQTLRTIRRPVFYLYSQVRGGGAYGIAGQIEHALTELSASLIAVGGRSNCAGAGLGGRGDRPVPSSGPRCASVQVRQARTAARRQGRRAGMVSASRGPVPQPMPGRHGGAAHTLGGGITAGDVSRQRAHDAGERRSVGNAQPARMALGRSEATCSGHPLSRLVGIEGNTHPGRPSDQDRRGPVPGTKLTLKRSARQARFRDPRHAPGAGAALSPRLAVFWRARSGAWTEPPGDACGPPR
ncbi:hypothetical protein SAMN02787118_11471 [Streptomyces mirabilis]|jgi:hypothetical protein|uniref:Uncharacterized protein n=1 Tax=Streptomyces mirabilis TaxID=68239 RepID=A0A1I2MXK4_9ACTN|nr:hypothetical protein SAMN02787118_11471 [Streptomyces mirabilis]